MEEERCWFLVSLKLSGEADPDELQELDALLAEDPGLRLRVAMLTDIWNKHEDASFTTMTGSYNRHLQRLSNHLSEEPLQYDGQTITASTEEAEEKLPVAKHWWQSAYLKAGSIAAVLVLMGGIGWHLFQKKEATGITPNTISTKRGSKSKIQLPDGTEVFLNGESNIAYNADDFNNNRTLQLNGEAFFDVAQDPQHPFVIQTSTMDIKVLGTAFNVRAYGNEKKVETSLIRGAVEVTLRNKAQNSIVLKPRQKLVVMNGELVNSNTQQTAVHPQPLLRLEELHYPSNDSMALATLWTRNKLVFDAEPLEEVAFKIERWYDVKVTIGSEQLKKTLYSGVFEDETLQQVMEALQLSGNWKYTIHKKEVMIRP